MTFKRNYLIILFTFFEKESKFFFIKKFKSISKKFELWYDILKSRGMDMEKGILDARTLACYIKNYYLSKFKREISPLKLQKALYFCFAYWGGFMRKSNKFKDSKEIQLDYSEYLFDNVIEAWVYGPVVPDVYHEKDLTKFEDKNLFAGKEYLQEYIDNVLDDILSVNDFKLVEISHEDECWKKHFKKKNIFHNAEIPKEDIIAEYAKNM